jgi:hypothetical protein
VDVALGDGVKVGVFVGVGVEVSVGVDVDVDVALGDGVKVGVFVGVGVEVLLGVGVEVVVAVLVAVSVGTAVALASTPVGVLVGVDGMVGVWPGGGVCGGTGVSHVLPFLPKTNCRSLISMSPSPPAGSRSNCES